MKEIKVVMFQSQVSVTQKLLFNTLSICFLMFIKVYIEANDKQS